MKTKMMTKTLLTAALMALSAMVPVSAATIQYSFTVGQLKAAVAGEADFGGANFCPGTDNLQQCGIYSIMFYDENFSAPAFTSMTAPATADPNAAWTTQTDSFSGNPTVLDNNALVNIAFVTTNTSIIGNSYDVGGSNQTAVAPLTNDAVFSFIMEAADPVNGPVQTNFWLSLGIIAFDPANNHLKAADGGHFMTMTVTGSEVPEASTWMMAIGAFGIFAGMRFRRIAA